MQDYPAAHSMDTNWFGVDASGNIALFDSGEGGAVPHSNYRLWQAAQIDGIDSWLLEMVKDNAHHLLELKTPNEVIAKGLSLQKLQDEINKAVLSAEKVYKTHYDLEKGTVKPLTSPRLKEARLWGWLLLLADDNVIPQLEIEEIEYNYIVRFAGKTTVVYVSSCRVVVLQRLIELDRVIAGKPIDMHINGLAEVFGLYHYLQDSGAPLPYTRRGKPLVPLRLDDLPDRLQDLVTWNWFDLLQFSESEVIQPIEHMPCDTWRSDKWWLDTQGQEHEKHPHDG